MICKVIIQNKVYHVFLSLSFPFLVNTMMNAIWIAVVPNNSIHVFKVHFYVYTIDHFEKVTSEWAQLQITGDLPFK